jgi:hypothetical protein
MHKGNDDSSIELNLMTNESCRIDTNEEDPNQATGKEKMIKLK